MIELSASDFAGPAYALRVDAALTPVGVLHDAVIVVRDGLIEGVDSWIDHVGRPNATEARHLPGTSIMPGVVAAHHHVIEPFVKALTAGEPAQLWRRFWLPLEAFVASEEEAGRRVVAAAGLIKLHQTSAALWRG